MGENKPFGKPNRSVGIVGGIRTPFARAGTQLSSETNLTLLKAVLKNLVTKYGLKGATLGDVALGAVINQSRDWNLAREAVLDSGLAWETPAVGVQRACGTSLEAAILIGSKISLGQIESGIAGGVDSMSDVPVFLNPHMAKLLVQSSKAKSWGERLKIWSGIRASDFKPATPAVTESKTGLSMGESCEVMAKEWKISRKEQDDLALVSHQNSVKAYEKGFYKDLVMAIDGLDRDNNMRADTSIEKLSKLKPSFDRSEKGTLTAGNSSPLTDGAAAVLMCSEEWAQKRNLKIQAYLVECEVAAVQFQKEGLLMAPTYAVSRMLDRANLRLQDFDFYEIHEAFAAQVLCTLKAWESASFCRDRLGRSQPLGSIDRSKLNVVGGSVALGHPFGATGARILASAAKLLEQKGSGRALISICTGGGMGVTAILER